MATFRHKFEAGLKLRGEYRVEEPKDTGKRGAASPTLVILTSIPYGINKSTIVEKIAEVIVALETCKALGRVAEVDAAANRFGLFTPAWAPLRFLWKNSASSNGNRWSTPI